MISYNLIQYNIIYDIYMYVPQILIKRLKQSNLANEHWDNHLVEGSGDHVWGQKIGYRNMVYHSI